MIIQRFVTGTSYFVQNMIHPLPNFNLSYLYLLKAYGANILHCGIFMKNKWKTF